MAGESTIKDVGIFEKLHHRMSIPDDYHGKDIIIGDWLGEVYHTPTDQYYTQSTRTRYYFPEVKPEGGFDKHICPGHWSGYRWAIQQFTKEGDTILDPTVGTGTAVVEAINHRRNAVGIELEYSEITKRTIQVQYDRTHLPAEGKGTIIEGDARDLDKHVGDQMFDMVINGTPYPVLGGGQSDSPERGYTSKTKGKHNIKYQKDKNVGVLKGQVYWDTILQI